MMLLQTFNFQQLTVQYLGMNTPKRYLHDKVVLVLLSAIVFFAVFNALWVLLRLDSSRSAGRIVVQYRPSLGLSGYYYNGGKLGVLSLAIFSLFILVFHTIMSIKVYKIRRQLSLVILALGLLLILLTLVISNALFLLR